MTRPKFWSHATSRLNAVLVPAYLEADDAGWGADAGLAASGYPDLADDLREFFDAEARVAALASPPLNGHGKATLRGSQTPPTPELRARSAKSVGPVTAVGDYASLEVIKEGGMGIVYKAWQKGANRWVALKMIRAGQLATLAEVRRFRDEAEAVANLDHPHIVPIYEVGEHQGLPFFSMKLFETGSLHQHLDRYTRDLPAAVKLLATVCRAVHYGHQRGILHRDLKPANILLDAQGQPHVTDFGLAKRLFPAVSPASASTGRRRRPAEPTPLSPGCRSRGPSSRRLPTGRRDGGRGQAGRPGQLPGRRSSCPRPSKRETVSVDGASRARTATGVAVGTPGYWAPENTRTVKTPVSTAADVYSLGAILYRLLSGQTLFPTASRTEAVRLAREGVPDLPSKLNPRCRCQARSGFA